MFIKAPIIYLTCWCRTRRRTTLLVILLAFLVLFTLILTLAQQPGDIKYSVITYSIHDNNGSATQTYHQPTAQVFHNTLVNVYETTKKFNEVSLKYIDIFRKMSYSSKYIPNAQVKFKTVMNESEMNITLETLDVFAKTMDLHNLTYFLYGGTLIGSLRHHGPIPWDDDIDVIVNKSQSQKVWKALQSLSPNYIVTKVRKQKFWKIFSKNAHIIYPGLAWKWPFVDIWLYEDSGKTITDWSCPWCKPKAVYPKENIFPLKKRPFGPLSLNTPCKSRTFLDSFYKWEHECDSRFWNHRKEQQFSKTIQNVSCKRLEKYFPFVKRLQLKDGTFKEMLMFKGVPISYFYDTSKC